MTLSLRFADAMTLADVFALRDAIFTPTAYNILATPLRYRY